MVNNFDNHAYENAEDSEPHQSEPIYRVLEPEYDIVDCNRATVFFPNRIDASQYDVPSRSS